MAQKYPKYLRELDKGTVEKVEIMYGPNSEQGTTDYLYQVTANLGNMRAFIYTQTKYRVGSSINLKKEKPYEIQMLQDFSFNKLQALLEKFGKFHVYSEDELARKELLGASHERWSFQTNKSHPIVIQAYVDAMSYCTGVIMRDGKALVTNVDNLHSPTPKNLYDLGVLHAQLQIELDRGEAIKSGVKSLSNQNKGRRNSKVTKTKNKVSNEKK